MKKIIITLLISYLVTACQSNPYSKKPAAPSEAALVANAVNNGMSQDLHLSYMQVYQNLRVAYSRCVGFTAKDHFVFTDARLEEHLAMATIFARGAGGIYFSKVLIESISPTQTLLTLFVPKDYVGAKARFQQEIARALAQDSNCKS